MSNKIILNEREYIENLLDTNSLGENTYNTLKYAARYYYSIGCKPSEIKRNIESFILRCDEEANLAKLEKIVDKFVRSSGKYKLVELSHIPITQAEIDVCKNAGSKNFQKLAFTMLCIAKYYNEIIPNGNGWVNRSTKEIFSMANMSKTKEDQAFMERKLYENGLIDISNKIDSDNVRVTFIDNEGDPVLKIRKLESLGIQYESYVLKGKSFSECKLCGCIFQQNNNKHVFCKKCRAKRDALNGANRAKAYRDRHVENTEL